MIVRFRATLKPYWTWAAAIVLSMVVWSYLILLSREQEVDGFKVIINGSLYTSIFFALPLSQVISKLFGRVAGPARNRLAHLFVGITAYVVAFGLLAIMLFLLVNPVAELIGWLAAK